MGLKENLRAYRLQKEEEQEAAEAKIAAQRTTKKNALMTSGLALLLAGCTSLGIWDTNRTQSYDDESKPVKEFSETYAEILNEEAIQLKNIEIKQERLKNKSPAPEKCLDELLRIREGMSSEEIGQIIEIEKLRYENYLMSAGKETSPKQAKPNTKLQGKFAKYETYRPTIESEVAKYNAKFRFPKPLTANHVYAMIEVESGNHPQAFKKDPMQIANEGDHALEALKYGREYTWQIGDFSFLKGKKQTKIRNWFKHYQTSNMDAESSIKGGIGWLVNKAAVRDNSGKITAWRDWETAANRYNGGGDNKYKTKVKKNIYQLNALTKL